MKYTLLLSAAIVAFYLIFSSGWFYIPDEQIMQMSFSKNNLLGIFTYSFSHIGPTHLLGNLFLLIPLGIVAERKLKMKDFFAIYFSSAFLAAILFILLVPDVALVGASAAIAGLVIPACLIDFKRTIMYVAAFTVIAILLTYAVNFTIVQSQKTAEEQVTALKEQLNKTAAEKNQTATQIQTTEEKYQKGEITQQQYNETKQQLNEKLENLTQQEQSTIAEVNKTASFAEAVKYGQDREKVAQTSMAIHLVGSMWGLAYLYLFRRDIIYKSGIQFLKFQNWLAKQKKAMKK